LNRKSAIAIANPSPAQARTNQHGSRSALLAGSGREVFTGNELLVKGCLEVDGGVHLMTGYPARPSPASSTSSATSPSSSRITASGLQANNEALGAAPPTLADGPCRAVVTMKSVGVHVASDALALGTLAGANPEGGVVFSSCGVPARHDHPHMLTDRLSAGCLSIAPRSSPG